MKLTKIERWILANQYRILEALYPQEAKSFARCQEILENGYELQYDWITQHIYKDGDTMSADECREVLDILSMFNEMAYRYEKLSVKDKKEIDKAEITFDGFDGNDSQEVKYLAYARFYCEGQDRPFARVVRKRTDIYNSHFPALEMYRRMLGEWKKSEHKNQLTKEDILRIARARVHPSNR